MDPSEMPMQYVPQEGVDYIVDLYSVVGLPPDADPSTIHTALNERTRQYHPDRLHELAPEFVTKGERMTRLLNRARGVLLSDKRAEYDEILQAWTGPVSRDGIPVIRMSAMLQAEAAAMQPAELEASLIKLDRQAEAAIGYMPSRLDFIQRLVDAAGENVPDDLRAEYEATLLQRDQVLAVQASERAKLLGVDTTTQNDEVGVGYAEAITGDIAAARETKEHELRSLAAGNFAARLALLSGEEHGSGDLEVVASTSPSTLELPAYFDMQSERVQALAVERERILSLRLANLAPVYPEEARQTEFRDDFMVGIGEEGSYMWYSVHYDQATHSLSGELPEKKLQSMLNKGKFSQVIERGYNVVLAPYLAQVDLGVLLGEVATRYIAKFSHDSEEA